MIALEPGLYRATVRGVADQIVLLTATAPPDPWFAFEPQSSGPSSRWFRHADITDARPLIVLDLEDHGRVNAANLAQVLREDGYPYLADQIEAQCKLARIEEPGLWGVIEASLTGTTDPRGIDEWVHRVHGWHCPAHGFVQWALLIDPVLVREGVESPNRVA